MSVKQLLLVLGKYCLLYFVWLHTLDQPGFMLKLFSLNLYGLFIDASLGRQYHRVLLHLRKFI